MGNWDGWIAIRRLGLGSIYLNHSHPIRDGRRGFDGQLRPVSVGEEISGRVAECTRPKS
jgi:hypothetical protein